MLIDSLQADSSPASPAQANAQMKSTVDAVRSGHNAVVMVVKVAGVQGETAAQLNGVYEPVKEHSGKLSMYNDNGAKLYSAFLFNMVFP